VNRSVRARSTIFQLAPMPKKALVALSPRHLRLFVGFCIVAFVFTSMSETPIVAAILSPKGGSSDADSMNPPPPIFLAKSSSPGTPLVSSSLACEASTTPASSSKRLRVDCCSRETMSSSSSTATTATSTPGSSAASESESPLFGLTLSQDQCKRNGYLSWHEYFLATAILSSHRSKDPYSPSGACLVDPDNRIVGIGYNGFPSGFADDKLMSRPDTSSSDPETWLESREPFLIPAEVNCLLNSAKTSRNTTMYCVDIPSHDCAKFIVQSRRVAKVVYGRPPAELTDSVRVSQLLLQQAGIELELFQLARPIELIFEEGLSSGAQAEDVRSYLSWDEYFMAMALLTSYRSKDPNTQVGACMVSRRRIILACGYNGFTRGCSDDTFPWQRSALDPKHTKYMYVCHAEVNAILNCQASQSEQDGSTLYVTLFPCNQCAQAIVQAGIRRVVYLSDPYHEDVKFRASRRLFDMAKVEYAAFQPVRGAVTLSANQQNH
jgi:dCMP deaminase